MAGDLYGGTTNVHGIPLYGEDITEYLEGSNIDIAVSTGADAFGKISGTKGLSADLDSGLPVYTDAGLLGYQYATENSVEIGANAVPNGLDVSIEGGMSQSWVISKYEIPWWPR